MEKYNVSGMSCAACSARVEKAVSSVDGVASCSVNLLTNSMTVTGTADSETIISAVAAAGYGASLKETDDKSELSQIKEKELSNRKNSLKRFIASAVILLVLIYFSMGHTMLSLPLPDFFVNNPIAIGLAQLLLSFAVIIINFRIYKNGAVNLIKLSPNMDSLVATGSLAAFFYSMAALILTAKSSDAGYLHNLYFESAAMVPTLITLGKMLESVAKGKTTESISDLMKLAPKKAAVIRNEKELSVNIEEILVGDIFVVKAGDAIPADGTVIEGTASVDESALTGESIPTEKDLGAVVYAATVNKNGYIKCKATKIGKDTAFGSIIEIVNDAASSKAPIARTADKISGIFVPFVFVVSAITLAVWLLVGNDFGDALSKAVSVLVISCPCALGLATPVAVMVGCGIGAKNGVLFKTAAALEEVGKAKIIAFDKTGTLTYGKPAVTDVIVCSDYNENKMVSIAASLEKCSNHPIAVAVLSYSQEKGIEIYEPSSFENVTGFGIKASVLNEEYYCGKPAFVSGYVDIPKEIFCKVEELASEGKTPIILADGKKVIGIIAVADRLKEDSADAVKELNKMGISTVMISGDNELTVKRIAAELGISKVYANVLPAEKEKIISELKKQGKTVMVGDGVNDAPALVSSDVGIAIGAGADVAIDSADVVIVKNKISDMVFAVKLSKATIENIYENLFWAFGYNLVGIPLAAGAFVSVLGWQLSPMFGAAAMSVSSVLVVMNALRLNLMKFNSLKENKAMKKVIKIEGMMCPHCEARVKKLLDGANGITNAEVSYKKGTAVIEIGDGYDEVSLIALIQNEGYKVISVK